MLCYRPLLERLYGGLTSSQVEADDSAHFDVGKNSPPHEVAYRALGDAKVIGNPFAILPPGAVGTG